MIEEKQQITLSDEKIWYDLSDRCSPAKNSNVLRLNKKVNALKHQAINGFVSISNDEPCYNIFPKPTNLSFQIILAGVLLSITELGLFEHG